MPELDIFSNRRRLPALETRDEFWARKTEDRNAIDYAPRLGKLYRNR